MFKPYRGRAVTRKAMQINPSPSMDVLRLTTVDNAAICEYRDNDGINQRVHFSIKTIWQPGDYIVEVEGAEDDYYHVPQEQFEAMQIVTTPGLHSIKPPSEES